MIIVVSKVQLRRGLEVDLPGSPINLDPLLLSPALDVGELGFTEDTNRLFIGYDPQPSSPLYNRPVFPYQNVEVLTESSPRLKELFADFNKNEDENDYFLPTTFGIQGMSNLVYPVNTLNPAMMMGSVVSAIFDYHVFSSTGVPIKQGKIRILGNNGSTTITDTEFAQATSGVTFGVAYNGTAYTLQCQNTTATPIIVYLRRVVVTGG